MDAIWNSFRHRQRGGHEGAARSDHAS
jgi:hypothetical protein